MSTLDHKHLSNTQRAIHELREMVFSGQLAPGSDHLESELAEHLGMSRTPVREAALTLESQGLVALRPRKGVRVLPISPDDMREIYDVLTELESMAARTAAQRKLDADSLAPMAQSIEDMERALAAQELESWADADDRFHDALAHLSDNSRVQMICDLMSGQVRRARAVTLFMRPMPEKSTRDHRNVFEAIRAGDATRAYDTHRAHRESARVLILELLERHRLHRV